MDVCFDVFKGDAMSSFGLLGLFFKHADALDYLAIYFWSNLNINLNINF
jgi:hypothetical protein